MKKIPFYVRTLTSACVIALSGMLCAGCLSFVIQSDASAPMFSASDVKAHFSAFGWGYLSLTGLLLLSCILIKHWDKKPDKHAKAAGYKRANPIDARKETLIRICVLAASAVMLVLGIMNGGLRDVFVKAVNICTECIGLG